MGLFADVPGGVEIGLANAEGYDVVHGDDEFEEFADAGWGQRGEDFVELAFGGGGGVQVCVPLVVLFAFPGTVTVLAHFVRCASGSCPRYFSSCSLCRFRFLSPIDLL